MLGINGRKGFLSLSTFILRNKWKIRIFYIVLSSKEIHMGAEVVYVPYLLL
jgi:hypothetical protein